MFPVTIQISNLIDLQRVMAALAEPTGAVKAADPKSAKGQPAPSPTASATDAKTQSATTTAQTGDAGNAAPAASTETTAAAGAQEKKAVTYAELQASVLKLHKLDATAAKPIAEGMGFPNFKAMPDDKWAEALAKVEAALDMRGA